MPFRKTESSSSDFVDLVAGDDVRNAAWYLLAQEIADLRASGDYAWAEAVLSGIQVVVTTTQRATPAQWATVRRIVRQERMADVFGRRW